MLLRIGLNQQTVNQPIVGGGLPDAPRGTAWVLRISPGEAMKRRLPLRAVEDARPYGIEPG